VALRTVAATVRRLQPQAQATFLPERLLLLGRDVQEPTSQLDYFQSLAVAAQRAANSVLCSSILAGHSSESDDFSDVSIWLGKGSFGKGNEQSILKALGLDSGGRISHVPISEGSKIPTTVRVNASTPELEDLATQLAELQDLHCFSSHPTSGSDVIYALVGKNVNGWGGLLGIGIWSDD